MWVKLQRLGSVSRFLRDLDGVAFQIAGPEEACSLGILLEWSLALGVYTAVRQIGRASCLPSDFPQYQGATITGLNVYNGTGGSRCDMTFDSADSASQVTDFYTKQLDQGNWLILSRSAADGTITFEKRSDPGVHGRLQVLGKGDHSAFEVVVQAGG